MADPTLDIVAMGDAIVDVIAGCDDEFLTVHNLPAIMAGGVEDVITACRTYYQAEALKQQTGGGPGSGPTARA